MELFAHTRLPGPRPAAYRVSATLSGRRHRESSRPSSAASSVWPWPRRPGPRTNRRASPFLGTVVAVVAGDARSPCFYLRWCALAPRFAACLRAPPVFSPRGFSRRVSPTRTSFIEAWFCRVGWSVLCSHRKRGPALWSDAGTEPVFLHVPCNVHPSNLSTLRSNVCCASTSSRPFRPFSARLVRGVEVIVDQLAQLLRRVVGYYGVTKVFPQLWQVVADNQRAAS